MKLLNRTLVPCVAAMVVMLPVGFALAQSLSSADEPRTSTQFTMPERSQLGPDGFPLDARPSDQPVGADLVERLLEGRTSTELRTCPEALAFFQQSSVRTFYEEHFGHAPGPEDGFVSGCPDVEMLERAYRNAQERVRNGVGQ